ncbi:hypothetical protein [Streptomyces sp. NPDC056061]|uniref:hypothetical protein n=1 Tax=Streptomyces sp. NPDC056061 TaxID=3345700 RepID=UPI0035E2184C
MAAPAWLAGHVDVAEFAHRYGPRLDGWRMPSSQTKRNRLAQVFGQDALALCRAAWAPDAPARIREIEPVRLLRQILVQTYYLHTDSRGREVSKKREADDEGVPPGQLRLASPYAPDARWAAKGEDLFWMGYKVHLTETCDTPAEAEAEAEAGVPAPPLAGPRVGPSPTKSPGPWPTRRTWPNSPPPTTSTTTVPATSGRPPSPPAAASAK